MLQPAVRSWSLRLLLIPAFVLFLVLVGLAVGSESRSDFAQRGPDGEPGGSEEAEDAEGGRVSSGESGGIGSPQDLPAEELDGLRLDPEGNIEVLTNLDIEGTNGSVTVRLDPDGPEAAFPRAEGEDVGGLAVVLDPEAVPEGEGLRLDPDGELRPGPIDEVEAGDVILRPELEGFSVPLADGDRLEVRIIGSQFGDRVEFIRVAPDGSLERLTPDEDFRIELGDGVAVQLPTPDPESGQTQQQDQGDGGPIEIDWRIFLAWLAIMLVGSVALAYYLHRNGEPILFHGQFTAPPEVPVERLVDFLAYLTADPDPARAVRLAFEGAEHGLGTLPPREATETPFEWHQRVQAAHPHLGPDLATLCSLFATARFAPERPTGTERDQAVEALRRLADLAGYRDPEPSSAASPTDHDDHDDHDDHAAVMG